MNNKIEQLENINDQVHNLISQLEALKEINNNDLNENIERYISFLTNSENTDDEKQAIEDTQNFIEMLKKQSEQESPEHINQKLKNIIKNANILQITPEEINNIEILLLTLEEDLDNASLIKQAEEIINKYDTTTDSQETNSILKKANSIINQAENLKISPKEIKEIEKIIKWIQKAIDKDDNNSLKGHQNTLVGKIAEVERKNGQITIDERTETIKESLPSVIEENIIEQSGNKSTEMLTLFNKFFHTSKAMTVKEFKDYFLDGKNIADVKINPKKFKQKLEKLDQTIKDKLGDIDAIINYIDSSVPVKDKVIIEQDNKKAENDVLKLKAQQSIDEAKALDKSTLKPWQKTQLYDQITNVRKSLKDVAIDTEKEVRSLDAMIAEINQLKTIVNKPISITENKDTDKIDNETDPGLTNFINRANELLKNNLDNSTKKELINIIDTLRREIVKNRQNKLLTNEDNDAIKNAIINLESIKTRTDNERKQAENQWRTKFKKDENQILKQDLSGLFIKPENYNIDDLNVESNIITIQESQPQLKSNTEIKSEINPEKIVEENKIINRELEEFNITAEDIRNNIEEFNDLSLGKKLLLIENFKQLTLGRIQEETQDQYKKDASQSKFLGRIWRGITKNWQLSTGKKITAKEILNSDINSHKDILDKLTMATLNGPEVKVKEGGELEIQFASSLGNIDKLDKNDQKVVDNFNDIANKLARTPIEWSYETANKEEKNDYEFIKKEYEQAKNKLLKLKEGRGIIAKNENADRDAMMYLNKVEGNIKMNQFLNTHPEAERALQNIQNENVFIQGLKDTVTERGGYILSGYIGRTVLVGAAGLLAAPIVAAGMGAYIGRKRAKEELKSTDIEARRDKSSNLDKKGRMERNYVNATESINKLQKQITELKTILNNESDIKDDLSNIKEVIEKLKIPKLLESLSARIDYTNDKLEAGRINYGAESNRIKNQYDLITTLNEAKALKNTLNLLGTKSELDERLASFLATREERIIKTKQNTINKKTLASAGLGATFALTGVAARIGVEHYLLSGEESSTVANDKISKEINTNKPENDIIQEQPKTISSIENKPISGTIEKGGNVWNTAKSLIRDNGITKEQFQQAWSSKDSLIDINGKPTHISKLGLTHAGDKIIYIPESKGVSAHFEVIDNASDKFHLGDNNDLRDAIKTEHKTMPKWLEEKSTNNTPDAIIKDIPQPTKVDMPQENLVAESLNVTKSEQIIDPHSIPKSDLADNLSQKLLAEKEAIAQAEQRGVFKKLFGVGTFKGEKVIDLINERANDFISHGTPSQTKMEIASIVADNKFYYEISSFSSEEQKTAYLNLLRSACFNHPIEGLSSKEEYYKDLIGSLSKESGINFQNTYHGLTEKKDLFISFAKNSAGDTIEGIIFKPNGIIKVFVEGETDIVPSINGHYNIDAIKNSLENLKMNGFDGQNFEITAEKTTEEMLSKDNIVPHNTETDKITAATLAETSAIPKISEDVIYKPIDSNQLVNEARMVTQEELDNGMQNPKIGNKEYSIKTDNADIKYTISKENGATISNLDGTYRGTDYKKLIDEKLLISNFDQRTIIETNARQIDMKLQLLKSFIENNEDLKVIEALKTDINKQITMMEKRYGDGIIKLDKNKL